MKKGLKVIGIILSILLVCWLCVFGIDYNRTSQLKTPVFAQQTDASDEKNHVIYKGIGYTVEIEEIDGTVYGSEIDLFGKIMVGAVVQ